MASKLTMDDIPVVSFGKYMLDVMRPYGNRPALVRTRISVTPFVSPFTDQDNSRHFLKIRLFCIVIYASSNNLSVINITVLPGLFTNTIGSCILLKKGALLR